MNDSDIMKRLSITTIPEISAIYYALLQCGYDYDSLERDSKHCDLIRSFTKTDVVPSFFSDVRQNTCEVYPYWPRAAMLETASFFLRPGELQFRDFDAYRERIMSAGNISDDERGQSLWEWIAGFPAALDQVLRCDGFRRYMEWENRWITEQNERRDKDLRLIEKCLDVCRRKYDSPVRDVQIVINPIKCVFSADYHLIGDRFVFSSGRFRADSVIHELLHHVVHPIVTQMDSVGRRKTAYADMDASYYLSGDKAGYLNAFEEYVVRKLTKDMMEERYPEKLNEYIARIADTA